MGRKIVTGKDGRRTVIETGKGSKGIVNNLGSEGAKKGLVQQIHDVTQKDTVPLSTQIEESKAAMLNKYEHFKQVRQASGMSAPLELDLEGTKRRSYPGGISGRRNNGFYVNSGELGFQSAPIKPVTIKEAMIRRANDRVVQEAEEALRLEKQHYAELLEEGKRQDVENMTPALKIESFIANLLAERDARKAAGLAEPRSSEASEGIFKESFKRLVNSH